MLDHLRHFFHEDTLHSKCSTQFIKAAPVSEVLRETGHHEVLVYTGQHYDLWYGECLK
jgi:hypothetical protein